MKARRFILFSGIMTVSAVIIQMFVSLGYSFEKGRSLALALNIYFSYFTVLCNSTLAVVFLSLGLKPESRLSHWFKKPAVSAALCLYILIVGIIFYALLVKEWTPRGIEFFATHTMHFYVPAAYFYLWFKHLRQSQLSYRHALYWLSVPAVYFIYLMIRGAIIGLYPYFFVDVGRFGLEKVLLFAGAILLFFSFLGSLLVYLDRRFIVPSDK